jgi:hypothetical protein
VSGSRYVNCQFTLTSSATRQGDITALAPIAVLLSRLRQGAGGNEDGVDHSQARRVAAAAAEGGAPITASASPIALYRATVRSILRQRGHVFEVRNQCTCANDRVGGTSSTKQGTSTASSFHHLIRPLQEQRRDRQAARLGGLEVDDQLERGRLLNRGGRRAYGAAKSIR